MPSQLARAQTTNSSTNEILLQEDYEGKILQKIVIKGNINLARGTIRGMLKKVQINKPLFEDMLHDDFKLLYKSGNFKDIKFQLNFFQDELTLTIFVMELEKIRKIQFIGNRKFSGTTLLDGIAIQEGDYYSESLIKRAQIYIKEQYRTEGYLDTQVFVQKTSPPKKKSKLDIVFDIIEGNELLVNSIKIKGNTNVTSGYLQGKMETKKDEWWREGKFDSLVFESDNFNIVNAYKERGYIDARIVNTLVQYRWRNPKIKKTKFVALDIEVEEGEKYFFGDIKFKGNRLFSKSDLLKVLNRKKGDVFNQKKHEQDLQTLTSLYHQKGYIFIRIAPLENINTKTRYIDYVFDVYEGDIAHIENIFITGNVKTKDYVIKRELEIREGEIFNSYKIQRSREKLLNLQFFKAVLPEPRLGSVEGLMNLNIKVQEQLTALISGGGGYGTQTGISLRASVKEANFFGTGQSLEAALEYGQRKKTLLFTFTEPWFLGNYFDWDFKLSLGSSIGIGRETLYYDANIKATNREGNSATNSIFYLPNGKTFTGQNIDYTKDTLRASLFSGQRFWTWYNNSISYAIQLEREYLLDTLDPFDLVIQRPFNQEQIYELNAYRFSTPPPREKDFQLVHTISYGLSRDSRDNWLNATRGSTVGIRLDLLFGDKIVSKWNFNYAVYTKVFNIPWLVALYAVDLWTLGTLFNSYKYNQSYRFYVEEIRGWQPGNISAFRQTLAKKGHLQNTTGSLALGKAKIRHTIELRYRIYEPLLWGNIFMDAGNLSQDFFGFTNNQANFIINYWEQMYDLGFGIRLQVPQLPLRFFWAWRFIYDRDNNRFTWFQPNSPIFGIKGFPQPTFVFTIAGFF